MLIVFQPLLGFDRCKYFEFFNQIVFIITYKVQILMLRTNKSFLNKVINQFKHFVIITINIEHSDRLQRNLSIKIFQAFNFDSF